MTCVDEVNGSRCGLNAVCFIDECLCEVGYFRPQDFGGEKLDKDCIGNDAAYLILYSIFAFFLAYSVLGYSVRIERFSQFKRLIPYFVAMTTFGIIAVVKLVDPTRGFTVDPLVTVLHFLSLPFGYFSNYIAQKKYLRLQHKLVPIMHKAYEKQLRRRQNFLFVGSCISVVGAILYVSTLFLTGEELLETKIIVIRVSFSILAVCVFSFIFALFAIGNNFERDLKLTPTLDDEIRDVITRAHDVKVISSIGFFIIGLLFVACIVTDYGLFYGSYIIPVQMMVMFITPIFVLRANVRKIQGRPNPRYIKRTKSSVKEAEKTPAYVYRTHKQTTNDRTQDASVVGEFL